MRFKNLAGSLGSDRNLAALWAIAGFKFCLQLVAIRGYGIFRDEYYYIACSQNLAFGYVDHPPLAMWLLRGIREVFGDSLLAMRLWPALCGFMFVFLTGLIARELGGRKFAVLLAAAAALAPLGNFFMHFYYSMNSLDHLFWLGCVYVLIKIAKTGNNRLWILFGVLAGFGLQNKISILFLGFGLAVGLLLTPARRFLLNARFWIGLIIALLIFSPFIVWNMTHDWAHLEFMNNARTNKNYAVPPGEFILGQILYNNPLTLPLWIFGLVFLLFDRAGRNFRFLGWMFLSVFLLLMFQHAKDYYLSGAYPIVFAAGGVQLEQWLERFRWAGAKTALVVILLASTLFLSPLALPILPVDTYITYAEKIGISGVKGENLELGILPQHYADMFGWKEVVSEVSRVYAQLSREEQKLCAIYADNYGLAGAINYLGPEKGLPPAISGHNSYYLWGPRGATGEVVIFVGGNLAELIKIFDEVDSAGRIYCGYCMPHENGKPIFICRNIKKPIDESWPEVKVYR